MPPPCLLAAHLCSSELLLWVPPAKDYPRVPSHPQPRKPLLPRARTGLYVSRGPGPLPAALQAPLPDVGLERAGTPSQAMPWQGASLCHQEPEGPVLALGAEL